MTKIIKEKEEVVTIGKSGTRTLMPSLEYAKQNATGLWKGAVKKIEVKTTYIVTDKKLFEEALGEVIFEIIQLESDRDNVGGDRVIRYIESELRELNIKKRELELALKIINEN